MSLQKVGEGREGNQGKQLGWSLAHERCIGALQIETLVEQRVAT